MTHGLASVKVKTTVCWSRGRLLPSQEGICCIKLVDYMVSHDKTVAPDTSDTETQSALQLSQGSSKFDALTLNLLAPTTVGARINP